MKLNPDCIRAVMLEIEDKHLVVQREDGSMVKQNIPIRRLYEALLQYSNEDIFYTVYNLNQAGYISASFHWTNGVAHECAINHMTFAGHEFLAKIRDDNRWSAAKSALSAVSDFSLAALNSIAEGITAGAVSAYLEKR